jgi:acyl carrier protein phosphodiesterase
MRFAVAFVTFVALAACSATPERSLSEQALTRQDDWRQRQADLDAQAILEGMAQARNRAQALARSGRSRLD